MNNLEQVWANCDAKSIIVGDFDDCIIGVSSNHNILYSFKKIFKKLVQNGMDAQSAHEWFGRNIEPMSYNTTSGIPPVFIMDHLVEKSHEVDGEIKNKTLAIWTNV